MNYLLYSKNDIFLLKVFPLRPQSKVKKLIRLKTTMKNKCFGKGIL